MSEHFGYLLDDNNRDFFQKVAEERAVSSLPQRKPRKALEMRKTAAPEPKSSFEKVASTLDQSIELIKMAGPRGCNLGASSRAASFMSRFSNDQTITDGEYLQIFSKVAMEAFDSDLEKAREDLHLDSSPEYHEDIDLLLGKFAAEFIKDAGWGKVVGGLAGRVWRSAGARGAQKAVSKAAPSVASKTRGASATVADRARGAGRTLKPNIRARVSGAASKLREAGGIRGAIAGRYGKFVQGRQAKLEGKVNALKRQGAADEAARKAAKASGNVQKEIQSKNALISTQKNLKKNEGRIDRATSRLSKMTSTKGVKGAKNSQAKGKREAAKAVEGAQEAAKKPSEAAGASANMTARERFKARFGREPTATPAKGADKADALGKYTIDTSGDKFVMKNKTTGKILPDRAPAPVAASKKPAPKTQPVGKTPIEESKARVKAKQKSDRAESYAQGRYSRERKISKAEAKHQRSMDKREEALARGKAAERARRAGGGRPSRGQLKQMSESGDNRSLAGRAYSDGWDTLSKDEKRKLMVQGAGAALAYKVVTD